jgi:Zn finger protein HypA/HybF involved in hydrogenase expression
MQINLFLNEASMKQAINIKATRFEVQCPHCDMWDDWGTCSPQGLAGECGECGKEYEVHPDADIESYQ